MAIVKCKVRDVNTGTNGTKISLTLTDANNHSWDKEYTFHQTEPIDITAFKNLVIADIKKDLNISAVADQLNAIVGQTFNLTI
jgi:hypothetical protein